MAFNKLTEDITFVSKMPDTPSSANGWSPETIKQQFDKAGLAIQNFINTFIDNLASAAAAGSIGVAEINGIAADTLQQALEQLQKEIEGVSMGAVPDGSITSEKLGDYAVSEAKIGEAAVSTGKIRDAAVTTAKIADGTVTAAKLADNSVGTGKIMANAVGSNQLAVNAVAANRIQDGAVTSDKIANSSVTNAKLANGAVANQQIYDGAVTTVKLAASAVTGAKMNLQNNDLPWAKLTYGVHYFNQGDTLPAATTGRIIFVKR